MLIYKCLKQPGTINVYMVKISQICYNMKCLKQASTIKMYMVKNNLVILQYEMFKTTSYNKNVYKYFKNIEV